MIVRLHWSARAFVAGACFVAVLVVLGSAALLHRTKQPDLQAQLSVAANDPVLALSNVDSNKECIAITGGGVAVSMRVVRGRFVVTQKGALSNGRIACASISSDGQVLATLSDGGRVLVLSREQDSKRIIQADREISAIAVTRSGDAIAYGDAAGGVWTANTSDLAPARLFAGDAAVVAVATCDELLLAADSRGAVVVLDRASGNKVSDVLVQPAGITSLACIGRSEIVIGTADGRLLRWDFSRAQEPRPITTVNASIQCAVVSPQTRRAIVGLRRNHKALWQWKPDQAALVVDLESDRQIALLETAGGVWSVAGDGASIFAGDGSGTVSAWLVK